MTTYLGCAHQFNLLSNWIPRYLISSTLLITKLLLNVIVRFCHRSIFLSFFLCRVTRDVRSDTPFHRMCYFFFSIVQMIIHRNTIEFSSSYTFFVGKQVCNAYICRELSLYIHRHQQCVCAKVSYAPFKRFWHFSSSTLCEKGKTSAENWPNICVGVSFFHSSLLLLTKTKEMVFLRGIRELLASGVPLLCTNSDWEEVVGLSFPHCIVLLVFFFFENYESFIFIYWFFFLIEFVSFFSGYNF